MNLCASSNKLYISQIQDAAKRILKGDGDVLEAIRQIDAAHYYLGAPLEDDPLFNPFRTVACELDFVPDHSRRDLYAKEFLERCDRETSSYLQQIKPILLDHAKSILELLAGEEQ